MSEVGGDDVCAEGVEGTAVPERPRIERNTARRYNQSRKRDIGRAKIAATRTTNGNWPVKASVIGSGVPFIRNPSCRNEPCPPPCIAEFVPEEPGTSTSIRNFSFVV
jgi:hypothetical protein